MVRKNSRNIMQQLLLIFCMLKKKKYVLLMFQNITKMWKKVSFLMISNGEIRKWLEILAMQVESKGCQAKSEGRWWHYLAVKKLSALLRGITSKHHGDFYCLNCLHSFATEKETWIT